MIRKIIIALIIAISLSLIVYLFLFENTKKNEDIVLYGNIDVRQVDLSFQVSGRVDKLFFEEGDRVLPGSLVSILDKQPYEDLVRQAEAELESTKNSLINAKILLNRRQELIKSQSISQEDLDNALTNTLILEANFKKAEASLAVSLTNLKFTECFAPTEGMILSRIREPGTVVMPSDPVYILSIVNPVWVRAFIPETYLGVVYPSMEAEISTDTKGGKIYFGKVGFISPVAEFTPKTVETTQLRTDLVYRLRIYADNPDQNLRQGMPVTVKLKIPIEKKKPLLDESKKVKTS